MPRKTNEEREFSENIDRLLAGQEVEVGEDVTEDLRTAIQFAQKMKDLGAKPSPAFKDQLGRRLSLKLAQQVAAAERQREKGASFWETLGNLVPRGPVWRTAMATAVVAVLAVVVIWGSGIFTQPPEQWAERGPVPAPASTPAPAPPAKNGHEEVRVATLDSGAILNVEPVLGEADVFLPGEEVRVDLVFRNTISESIIVTPFPPAIQISQADTGEVVRSLAPGKHR